MSQTSSQTDLIYYDHSISMLERTALRVYPIIKEIQTRMVRHKDASGTTFETHKNSTKSSTKGPSLQGVLDDN